MTGECQYLEGGNQYEPSRYMNIN